MVLPEVPQFVRQDIDGGFDLGTEGDPLALVMAVLVERHRDRFPVTCDSGDDVRLPEDYVLFCGQERSRQDRHAAPLKIAKSLSTAQLDSAHAQATHRHR